MKHKPSFPFVICVSVAVLLIVGLSVLVVLSFQKLKKTDKDLKKQKLALERIYKIDPFPSNANVLQEKRNHEALSRWCSNLVMQASAGQLDLKEQSPSKFVKLLGRARRELMAVAEERVVVPADCSFGFGRYFADDSKLPDPAHVTRLMQQLFIIDRLSQILFAEEIESLGSISRDEFEGGTSPRRAGRPSRVATKAGAGLLRDGDLYAKLSFTLKFQAKERTVLGVLNRLSEDELFIVPTRLILSKTEDDVRLYALRAPDVASEETGPGVPAKPPSVNERIVSGLPLEPAMDVSLKLDVYRFRKEPEA